MKACLHTLQFRLNIVKLIHLINEKEKKGKKLGLHYHQHSIFMEKSAFVYDD